MPAGRAVKDHLPWMVVVAARVAGVEFAVVLQIEEDCPSAETRLAAVLHTVVVGVVEDGSGDRGDAVFISCRYRRQAPEDSAEPAARSVVTPDGIRLLPPASMAGLPARGTIVLVGPP